MKKHLIVYGVLISILISIAVDLVRRGGHIQGVELSLTDQYYLLRNSKKKDEPRVVILAIEEEDIIRPDIGYPLFDKQLADILNRLIRLKPKAIGMDLYRDLPVPVATNFKSSIADHFKRIPIQL